MTKRLVDWIVSPALAADPDRRFRARVVAGLGLLLLGAGLPGGAAAWLTYGAADPRGWLAALPSLFQLLVLSLLRRGADHRPAAVLQLGVAFGGQVAFACFDGGIDSPALPWALLVPLLAAMALGPRAAWAGAGLVALEIVALSLLDTVGVSLGEAPVGAQTALLRGTSLGLLTGVLTVAAIFFEGARRAALNDSLEALNRLRTTHDELVRAHELTLEASQARRGFLARVSHEVRTPVQGLLGSTQLLLDRQTTAVSQELATHARDSARGLLGLLDDLLDVGRLEAGQLRLDDRPFDPRAPLEDAAHLLASAARDKGLVLLCYVSADVPSELRGDPLRLRQVTLNLLANALRYSDTGDVVLRASVSEGPGGSMLRVEVNDAGVGIDLDETPRRMLLRPFEQAEPFSTRSHGGAGLGLAIAAQLVGLMGGRLDVESTPGVGSTFWFTVPLRGASEPPEVTYAGQHAVVIGRHARSRSMIAALLRDWGMSARALAPDEALLQDLRSGRLDADVLLLDVQEGDDPVWHPDALGAEPVLSDTPLIAVTPAALLGGEPREPGAVLLSPPRQVRLRAALDRLARAGSSDPDRLEAARITGEHRLAAIPRGQGRVLIVEDDPVNALIGRRFLQRLGYEVEAASDGPTGLEAAEAAPFDAILMDCQLPNLSGYEVTEALRAGTGPNRATPILAVTAHALEDERERCLASGMNGCLVKPYEPEALGRELHELLGLGAQADADPTP